MEEVENTRQKEEEESVEAESTPYATMCLPRGKGQPPFSSLHVPLSDSRAAAELSGSTTGNEGGGGAVAGVAQHIVQGSSGVTFESQDDVLLPPPSAIEDVEGAEFTSLGSFIHWTNDIPIAVEDMCRFLPRYLSTLSSRSTGRSTCRRRELSSPDVINCRYGNQEKRADPRSSSNASAINRIARGIHPVDGFPP